MSFTTLTWGSDGDFGTVPTEINGGGNYQLVTDGSSAGTRTISTALTVESDGGAVDASVFFDGLDSDTADLNNGADNGNTSTATGSDEISGSTTVGGELRVDGDGLATVDVENTDVAVAFGPDDEDFFGGFEFAPFFTNGTLDGTTKSFADVYVYESVTVNGTTTPDSSFTVTISNTNGDSQSVTGTGTTALSIAPSSSAAVTVTLNSNGNTTATFNNVTVRAQPAVQVYVNGNWQYKPLSVLTNNGSEIIPSSIEHYDASSGVWA